MTTRHDNLNKSTPCLCQTLALALALASLVSTPAAATPWYFDAPHKILETSKDPLQRESAALVLGLRGAPAAIPLLSRLLANDKNPWVRARCAEALGLIGDQSAVKALQTALSSEKRPRVRRVVGEALAKLGHKEGVLELMWQLRSGTNHAKAEAMKYLVGATGRPLGLQVKKWWSYLAARGYAKFAARAGSQQPFEVGGKFRLHNDDETPWRVLPTVTVRLKPTRAAITARHLKRHERWHGPIAADGCLLLIESSWAKAPEPKKRRKAKKGATTKKAPKPTGPGLTLDALDYLLAQSPKLLGVGVDAPELDVAPASGSPVKKKLLARGLLALDRLGDLSRLNANGNRLLLLRSGDRFYLLAL